MQLREVAEKLGVAPVPSGDREIPVNFCLDSEGLICCAVEHGLEPAIADELRRQADRLCGNAVLVSYFNFLALEYFNDRLSVKHSGELPASIRILSEAEEFAFFALLAFTAIGSRRRVFASAGLPPESAGQAVADMFIWMDRFYRERRLAGLSGKIFRREYGVLNGSPLYIGRLQFLLGPFAGKIRVYRNRENGEVRVLSCGGVMFNRSGMPDGVNGDFDPVAWTSTFEEGPRSAEGNPVSPDGKVSREVVSLDTSVWSCVFREGDWTLDTCFPEGTVLDLDGCREAMRQALAFFRSLFPDRTIRGFSCFSWMLDPQYEILLRPDSKILAFMRQYYLFPARGGDREAIWHIFGDKGLMDGEPVPCETSLQRHVAEFLEHGGKLRPCGGFLLPDDLDRYGSMPYRVGSAERRGVKCL